MKLFFKNWYKLFFRKKAFGAGQVFMSDFPWKQHHALIFPNIRDLFANQCVWKLGERRAGCGERWKGGLMTAVSEDKNTWNLWREDGWLSHRLSGEKGHLGSLARFYGGIAEVISGGWGEWREDQCQFALCASSEEWGLAPLAIQANHPAKTAQSSVTDPQWFPYVLRGR